MFLLVGADRERCAFGGEALKHGDDAREGPALPCDIRLVICEKFSEHLIDIVAGAKSAQGFLDHHAYTEAHRRADGCGRDPQVAVASKRVVQCAGEIRRGVDERAVEIEDDVGSF